MRHTIRHATFLLPALLFFGCGPSVWERSFSYEPGNSTATHTETRPARIVVREAPWGRVGPALEAERERIIESDTHPDDWSESKARVSEEAILRELQLPIDTAQAKLIGRSQFRTTEQPNPESEELRTFAGDIGADYVVWSRRVLGKVDTVEHEPVRSSRWRTDRVWNDNRKRYEYERTWGPDTVWVPVVVARDEVRWVVFYITEQP